MTAPNTDRLWRLPHWLVIVLALGGAVAAYQAIHTIRIQGRPVTLEVTLKLERPDDVAVYFQDDYAMSQRNSLTTKVYPLDTFTVVEFTLLPTGTIQQVRFDPARGVNHIWVREMRWSGSSGQEVWDAEKIRAELTAVQDIAEYQLENGAVLLHTAGLDPFLRSGDFAGRHEKLATERTIMYQRWMSVLVVALFFYLCLRHVALDPQEIRAHFRQVSLKGSPVQYALLFAFLLLITAPLVLKDATFRSAEQDKEKRTLAKKPSLTMRNLLSYTRKYNPYIADHFGFRKDYVHWNNFYKVMLYRQSPQRDLMLFGEDGWMFYRERDVVRDFQRKLYFTGPELETIRDNLIQRRAWLESKGIKLYIMVAPDKQSIYPEFIPEYIPRGEGPTRMDQMMNYLDQYGVEILDPREVLRASKKEGRSYYKTDTHWTHWGALRAYRQLMERIRKDLPGIKAYELDEFNIVTKQSPGGDLAELVTLHEQFPREEILAWPKEPFTNVHDTVPRSYHNDSRLHAPPIILRKPSSDEPKLLFLRDSFGNQLYAYLSESFRESIVLWTHQFTADIIEAEKPDVIVHEVSEKFIFEFLRENPPNVVEVVPQADTLKPKS
ncbi:MAG: hypothetical protein AAGB22_00375 [Bacteroidota bacterium]